MSDNGEINETAKNAGRLQYLAVVDDVEEDVTEIPSEEDGLVLLDTVTAQFPKAIGLKFKCEETGNYRAVRVSNGRMKPPEGGWSNQLYYVVYPKGEKRSAVSDSTSSSVTDEALALKKCKAGNSTDTQDLIVLGLPWKLTDESLRKHFEQFGNVVFSQVKRNSKTGQSRGYGFVRYETLAEQALCLVSKHFFDGRYVEVKIPDSGAKSAPLHNRKVHVKMITEVPSKDLKEYFSKHGQITEVFCPVPFKGYAFITFLESGVAQKLYGQHTIGSHTVDVNVAAPKRREDGDLLSKANLPWQQQTRSQYGYGSQYSGEMNSAGGLGGSQHNMQQQQFGGGGNYGYGSTDGHQQAAATTASAGYGTSSSQEYGTMSNICQPPPPPPPQVPDQLGMSPSLAAAALALLANMGAGAGGGFTQQQQATDATAAAAAASVATQAQDTSTSITGTTQQTATSSAAYSYY